MPKGVQNISSFVEEDEGLLTKELRQVGELLGVPEDPRGGRKLRWVFVEDIDEEDSIFRGTSLEKGDRVLSINNTDLRLDPDPRAAYKACSSATEAIAMVVLKELTEEDGDGRPILREEMRCALDGSMKGLKWRC